MDVLGDGVLKFIACRVTIDGDISEDSPMEVMLYHCIDESFGCLPHIWSMLTRRKQSKADINMLLQASLSYGS